MSEHKPIPTSFSRVEDYEKCPLFFQHRHLLKTPDPAPPLPEGQEYPMDRGIRVHKLGEDFVQDDSLELPDEYAHHERGMFALRKYYKQGKVSCEHPIAFDKHWRPSEGNDFENTVYRGVADVVVWVSGQRVLIIDYKTGKKKGNEIKHYKQLMEYACCFMLLYPDLQVFDVQIWYLDLELPDNTMKYTFTRTQVARAFPRMKKRHEALRYARLFPPHPSDFACRFCPYKAGQVGRGARAYAGTGHCRRNVN